MSIEAMKLALEAFEWNYNTDLDNIPAYEKWAKMLKQNIATLRQAIEQAEQAQPVVQLMDMIVGNLVREGVNKHRARELADHFIKQSNYTNGYCTVRTDLLKEQAEKSEPVATMWQHGETGRTRISTPDSITDCDARWFKVSDLYTTPPPRQPLTDEELEAMAENHVTNCYFDTLKFARAIEAAHGIKENT